MKCTSLNRKFPPGIILTVSVNILDNVHWYMKTKSLLHLTGAFKSLVYIIPTRKGSKGNFPVIHCICNSLLISTAYLWMNEKNQHFKAYVKLFPKIIVTSKWASFSWGVFDSKKEQKKTVCHRLGSKGREFSKHLAFRRFLLKRQDWGKSIVRDVSRTKQRSISYWWKCHSIYL